jgi:VWFA-related protein
VRGFVFYDRLGTAVTQPIRAPLSGVLLTLLLTAAGALAQTQSGDTQTPVPPAASPATAPAQPPVDKNAQEMTTKEDPALFKARVNLVLVPVVVRDSKGRTLGTYTKENFQLFDKGKPQEITKFSVEKSGDKAAKAAQTVDTIPPGDEGVAPPDIPERFIAYLFDDVHLQFGDLVRARDAASRQMAGLKTTERAAIYTTSGQNQVDFTSDIDKLHQALLQLRSRSITDPGGIPQCPDISYYMADMIVNKNDTIALSAAASEVGNCNPGMTAQQAQSMVDGIARQVLGAATQETHVSLIVLKDVVRRMSLMPGQRILVLLSPGFITPQEQTEKSDVIDRAIHGNVLINTLDARGLWTDPMLDASRPSRSATTAFSITKQQYDRASASAQADVLAELAVGTGGSFFQNNNDLDAGLRRLTVAPEYYYVLGFSPQNLKLDGQFHSLKVTLKASAGTGADIQARKGYYAPKKLSNAAETAKEEIEEALFSREEMNELPVQLHTQYFKASDKEATIAVLCRMDPKHIQFRKADGRNNNSLTIVSGLFDRDGNFVSGIQKTVDLKLKDETLAKLLTAGTLSVKTNFSVPPGTYMIRLVVRDSEGQFMSAVNGAVAIQ